MYLPLERSHIFPLNCANFIQTNPCYLLQSNVKLSARAGENLILHHVTWLVDYAIQERRMIKIGSRVRLQMKTSKMFSVKTVKRVILSQFAINEC
jgi:hypothetical protein